MSGYLVNARFSQDITLQGVSLYTRSALKLFPSEASRKDT